MQHTTLPHLCLTLHLPHCVTTSCRDVDVCYSCYAIPYHYYLYYPILPLHLYIWSPTCRMFIVPTVPLGAVDYTYPSGFSLGCYTYLPTTITIMPHLLLVYTYTSVLFALPSSHPHAYLHIPRIGRFLAVYLPILPCHLFMPRWDSPSCLVTWGLPCRAISPAVCALPACALLPSLPCIVFHYLLPTVGHCPYP